MTENELSKLIIGACIKVHRILGPGLLESVYEEALNYELKVNNKLFVERQKPIPVYYAGIKMEKGFRADLIVENKVLIELKSISEIAKIHEKTIHTYIRLIDLKLGLLINFNETLLKNGITRVVNNLEE